MLYNASTRSLLVHILFLIIKFSFFSFFHLLFLLIFVIVLLFLLILLLSLLILLLSLLPYSYTLLQGPRTETPVSGGRLPLLQVAAGENSTKEWQGLRTAGRNGK